MRGCGAVLFAAGLIATAGASACGQSAPPLATSTPATDYREIADRFDQSSSRVEYTLEVKGPSGDDHLLHVRWAHESDSDQSTRTDVDVLGSPGATISYISTTRITVLCTNSIAGGDSVGACYDVSPVTKNGEEDAITRIFRVTPASTHGENIAGEPSTCFMVDLNNGLGAEENCFTEDGILTKSTGLIARTILTNAMTMISDAGVKLPADSVTLAGTPAPTDPFNASVILTAQSVSRTVDSSSFTLPFPVRPYPGLVTDS